MASEDARLPTVWATLLSYVKAIPQRYRKLPLYGKLAFWLWVAFDVFILIIVIILTPGRIAQFLHDEAAKLAEMAFGWMVLFFAITIVSFPPLIGHTTLSTLCGFAFGMKGFFIAASASLVGSALAFVILRALFAKSLTTWTRSNDKWQALEDVVRAKGLPLIILIRLSPIPWVYNNSLFASIEAVTLWQFAVATVFVFPKIALEVFIGSRMDALSDGENRGKMDTETKILNVVLICVSILTAVLASIIVYKWVQNHVRKLDGLPREVDELAAEALEEAIDEEAPLLRSRSPNLN